MSDDLDWGPDRPPASGWAGALLLITALAQIGAIGVALLLDSTVLLSGDAERIVAGAVLGLLAFQVLAAIGVLRMWRGWRGIAMFLCVLGLAVQGANLAGPPDRPVVVGISIALALAYGLVIVLLLRSRDTSR